MANEVNETIARIAEQHPEAFVAGLEAGKSIAQQCIELGTEIDVNPEGDVYGLAANQVVFSEAAERFTRTDLQAAGVAIVVAFEEAIEKQGEHA